MKKEPIKFSDYKLVIPNMRKFIKKMEQFVNELKACNNAEEATKIIKKLNKFNSEIETQVSVIYVLYSCDTTNPEYAKAQEYLDEVSPTFSKYGQAVLKVLAAAPYRQENLPVRASHCRETRKPAPSLRLLGRSPIASSPVHRKS